jgi:hypothetical protein
MAARMDIDRELERLANDPTPPVFELGDGMTLRPLTPDDRGPLGEFLTGLSATTRSFYTLDSYDDVQAGWYIDGIGQWGKLILVAVGSTPGGRQWSNSGSTTHQTQNPSGTRTPASNSTKHKPAGSGRSSQTPGTDEDSPTCP